MGDDASLEISAHIGSLEIGAAIAAGLDEMNGNLKKVRDLLERSQDRYQERGPIQIRLRNAKTAPSAQPGTFSIGLGGEGPTKLRKWEVRRLVIGGTLETSTAGGTAIVITSPVDPLTVLPSLVDTVDIFATMPGVHFYSAGQFIVKSPDKIWIVVTGAYTNGAQYTVGGEALDIPDITAEQAVGV